MNMLEHYLSKYFGYHTFKHNQKEIIEATLDKQDVFAMLATGSGKSLCFQLPAFMNEGITIVISPLLALMENQVQELKQMGLKRVAAYNSFLSFRQKKFVLHHLSEYKLLYISPESLQQEEMLSRLKKQRVSLIAVDEAHCISQWGHEFRTDYLKLGKVKEMLGSPPCLALTATAAPEVQKDILHKLHLHHPLMFCDSVDRPNISYEVVLVDREEEKKEKLIDYISSFTMPGMVYTQSRKKAELLSDFLKEQTSLSVSAYHGGMTQEDRNLVLQQFLSGEIDVVSCTNAFGMGINKHDIRFVFHYDYPKDIESYVQETGRAGRDGEKSRAVLLQREEDTAFPRMMIDMEFPTESQLVVAYQTLKNNSEPSSLEKDLMLDCDFSEVQARFFLHYWKEWRDRKQTSCDANTYIKDVIVKRKTWKMKKLTQMEDWVENKTVCRRYRLLQYFGETLEKNPEECCDICGLSYPQKKEAFPIKKEKEMPWRQRLREILHQK